ncbi:RAVE subunit 2/Rogdi [Corynascus similis CBS 632.67]
MSVEIWPHIAPDALKAAIEETEKRELDWLIEELQETFTNLKHGLEDCYALLAPIDPGSTLVLSTTMNEIVKGHVTRVGTRIVKGTIHLRMRTLPHQTLTINPEHPIHLTPLTNLHSLLTHSIDLLNLTLTYSYPSPTATTPIPSDLPPPNFLSAQLRLLSQSLSEALALLNGPPLWAPDPSWTSQSVAPSHFTPPQPPTLEGGPGSSSGSANPSLSFHIGIQDSSLVLSLRSLEPADAPVNFGTKLALAIGTARRLEHDEADKVFGYCCSEEDHALAVAEGPGAGSGNGGNTGPTGGSPGSHPVPLSGTRKRKPVEVFVREKVRVESADPSLLSLSAKLTALSHTLALARRNLAAVLGEEFDGKD